MIYTEREELIRLTLSSGRQIEQWVRHWEGSMDDGRIVAFRCQARTDQSRIALLAVRQIVAVEVVRSRTSIRFGKQSA